MMVPQLVKDNPYKIILGSVGSIITIITALFSVDARYAHAADVEKDKAETKQTIILSMTNLRRQTLEDKIFEIDLRRDAKGKLTQIDQALKDRYQRQLDEISKK